MLDILFVTYNSEKWLEPCIRSLAESDYDRKQVTLNFYDNHSGDATCDRLAQLKEEYGSVFAAFRIGQAEDNPGFGTGNNRAAAMGDGEFVFCLNADTTVYPDTLRELMTEIEQSPPNVGLWELRQFPYEHAKFYDPLTRETTWSSGACMVLRRALFEELGGFDENLFLYGEDVDLSWRVRAAGYRLIYVPKAVVNHYSYDTEGQVKPNQYVYGIINNLYLRHKFGTKKDVTCWHQDFRKQLQEPERFPGANAQLRKAFRDMKEKLPYARSWNHEHRGELKKHDFHFVGWDYAISREGAFFESRRPASGKTVSVIVRTCGRPAVLRETLISLRNQTYRNFEVIVEEDGPAKAEKMIREEFGDLNIRYEATGRNVGRCRAGNVALARATGDYLNFLDDDDLFYADHLETLVKELEEHPEYRIAHTFAFDTPITVYSRDPYRYRIHGIYGHVQETFNRVKLSHHNCFPIQAVMFERGVFEELGGFDEDLDVLEDWDLWVRYACSYPFLTVEKTTSVYRVPANQKLQKQRQKELNLALEAVRAKHETLPVKCSVSDLLRDYEDLMGKLPTAASDQDNKEEEEEPTASRDEQEEALEEEKEAASPPIPPVKRTLPYRTAKKVYDHFRKP